MTITYEDRVREAAQSVYGFYRHVVCLDYPDYTEPPHIIELSKKLEALCRGEFDNLCVAMPPRHSKSSMVTLAFPLWLILNDPSLNILIVNAELSLSEKFGIDLRDYLEDFSIQTGVYVSDVKHSSTHLKFEDEYGNLYKGGIKLVGASGGITGQDADYLIIDDPYKGFEDITTSLLNKKIEWFKTKIVQRREPHTKLIICHTRWHSGDLQGYLKENSPDEYTFLEYPAIQKDGTSLWPDRYSINFLENQRKEMGERLFSSIYQQQPLDLTGEFFDLDYLQYNKEPINITATMRAYDMAYSETGDYTVGILGYKDDENNFYIQDMVRGQFGNRNKKVVQQTAASDGENTPIAIEYGVGAAAKLLAEEWQSTLNNYTVQEITPIRSKEDRAFPLSNAILDGKVICNLKGKARESFLQEFIAFPEGGHDDIVDAVSHCYNTLFRTSKRNINAAIIEL